MLSKLIYEIPHMPHCIIDTSYNKYYGNTRDSQSVSLLLHIFFLPLGLKPNVQYDIFVSAQNGVSMVADQMNEAELGPAIPGVTSPVDLTPIIVGVVIAAIAVVLLVLIIIIVALIL